jgi:leucyl-tRNA synthetase
VAKAMRERLERIYKLVAEFSKKQPKKTEAKRLSTIDRWMLSRLQWHIKKTTEAMDKMAVRKAIQSVLYELDQDIQWYQRRVADRKEKGKSAAAYVLKEVLDAQIRMLAPVAPHICEELWEMIGGRNFVSEANWPASDNSKIDVEAEEKENLIMSVLEDTLNIVKATGITPKKVYYYTAAPWKWRIYRKALQKSVGSKISQKDLMKEFMEDAELRAKGEKVAKLINQVIDEVNRMPEERKQRLLQIEEINEHQTLKEAEKFFKKELKAEICIYNEEDPECYDPKKRSQSAKPFRPAIYIE